MQDLDSLRARVDQTAEKLAVAETERRERTSSLVEMLQRLEEKYTSQEDELTYYRQRLQPLEAANGELAALMGRLLDLIDAGFEHGGTGSLQEAATLAADMLGTEAPGSEAVAQTDEAALADQVLREFEETAVEQSLDDGTPEISDASAEESAQSAAEIVSDAGEQPEQIQLQDEDQEVLTEAEPAGQFEEVSSMVLDLETEEDAALGTEDLPSIVQVAADIAADDGLTTVAGDLSDDVDMSAVAEEIAAAVNAEATAAESLADDESADPADDIKALLARVEALAAKAEAMREPEEAGTRRIRPWNSGRQDRQPDRSPLNLFQHL